MNAAGAIRAASAAVVGALVAAASPSILTAQGVRGELGLQADVVRLRHAAGGRRTTYFDGTGVGAAARVNLGWIELDGMYARGEAREADRAAAPQPLWLAQARIGVRLAPWLFMRVGPDAWSVRDLPRLDLVSWMVGGGVDIPLVPGVIVGTGSLSTSFLGEAADEDLESGVAAEIGLLVDPARRLGASVSYRISRHVLASSRRGSERMERLSLTLGMRLW